MTVPLAAMRAHGDAALALLNAVPRAESAETRKQLAEIIGHLVQMRDGLIVARRAGEPVDPWLADTNAIISATFGTEFPVNGLNKKRVDESAQALRQLLAALPVA